VIYIALYWGEILSTGNVGAAGFAFEAFTGVWHLNVFDGGAFGSGVEDDIFSTEGDFFAEGVADPVIGQEEPFVGDGFVAFKDHAVEILNFSFGVFGTEENVFEGGDCFAVVNCDFDEKSLVETGGVEVIDDFEPAVEVAGVGPCGVIDAEAFDKVIVFCGLIIFECFNYRWEVGRLYTYVVITTVDELLDDFLAELFVEEFKVGSGYFSAHCGVRLGLEFRVCDRCSSGNGG